MLNLSKLLSLLLLIIISFVFIGCKENKEVINPNIDPNKIDITEIENFINTIDKYYTVNANIKDITYLMKVDDNKRYYQMSNHQNVYFENIGTRVEEYRLELDNKYHKVTRNNVESSIFILAELFRGYLNSFRTAEYIELVNDIYYGNVKSNFFNGDFSIQIKDDIFMLNIGNDWLTIEKEANVTLPTDYIDDSDFEDIEIPTDIIYTTLDNSKDNFSLKANILDYKFIEFYYDNGMAYYSDDKIQRYYEKTNDEYFFYEKTNETWQKFLLETDNIDPIKEIKQIIDDCKWTRYDENSKTFFGTVKIYNKSFSLSIEINKNIIIKLSGALYGEITIYDIGKTKISLPILL